MAMRTRSSNVPRTLPRIAPRVAGEIPWEAAPAIAALLDAAGADEVLVVDADAVEAEDVVGVEDDEVEAEGVVVMADVTRELDGVGVAVAEGVVLVDAGEVKPPYVQTPSVPSGIYSGCNT